MMRKFAIAAVLLSFAGTAAAQSIDRQIRDQLRSQGFSRIQIERDDGRIEVDARRGSQKVELAYDARTGRLLRQESRRVSQVDRSRDRWRSGDDDDDDGSRRGSNRASRDDDDDDQGRTRGGRAGGRAGGHDDDDDGGRSGGRNDDDD